MRFPFTLSAKMARYIITHKIKKTGKFAIVLQLEPLHTCNLTCTGCGRIREYSTNLKDMMSLEDCLGAATECNAPMVSICGGEPLIYPKIEELVDGLLDQGRIVYVCTNGMFMRKKMREYLARNYSAAVEPKLTALLAQSLITEKEAAEIRKGRNDGRPGIKPSKWMYWNVHVDGLEYIHDLIVEREGVFKECIEAIKMAKILGYQVATNCTVYKETDMDEIEKMFDFLSNLGVDGHTITPGYEYDAAKKDMIKRLNKQPEDFLPHAQNDPRQIQKNRRMGPEVHVLRFADLSGIPRGQARPALHRLGDPDPQRPRLEGPLLPDDRRPLRAVSGDAGEGRLGQVRRLQWRRPRSALRELHDPLRLRAHAVTRHRHAAR